MKTFFKYRHLVVCIQFICIIILFTACSRSHPLDPIRPNQIRGPLRVDASNTRYFTDGSGKAIYLTGSHTWNNLNDSDTADPPKSFDYLGYLNFLKNHNHNFMRMWAWNAPCNRKKNKFEYNNPLPWKRTGPGIASDGKLKFNLSEFNQLYFNRLRSRIIAAGERGIYVSIMLYRGWWLATDERKGYDGWTWHPFNIENNVNGIKTDVNGDEKGYEFFAESVPSAVKNVQKAYIRKIVDTVNDLDNILYEIVNEATPLSVSWQYEMINYLKSYEKTKSKQHPVGMTTPYRHTNNTDLFNSPADWISPAYLRSENYRSDPPAADGRKVILLDTDHLWGVGGSRTWVWKSFLRGYNPIFMDPYYSSERNKNYRDLENARKAMGYTLTYAHKINLKDMSPSKDLTSTGYCLANPGFEYLIYKPMSRNPLKHFFTVNLKAGTYEYEWFNPATGVIDSTGFFTAADGNKFFSPPFVGDAVIYIHATKH